MPKTRIPREASAPPPDLQTICLQRLLETGAEVCIFLLDGPGCRASLGSDNHTVLLQQRGSG